MIDPAFMGGQEGLEAAYLAHDDELLQSGFGGGPTRWFEERSPLVDAIRTDGAFLDVGCANGRLARDVEEWAAARGRRIESWGIDLGPGLVAAAGRASAHPERFEVADAWTWEPGRRWTYVYALLDQSPADRWSEWVRRLLAWVEPGGRLIIGSYGSRSRGVQPEPVGRVLASAGIEVSGESAGGNPVVTRFGWIDA